MSTKQTVMQSVEKILNNQLISQHIELTVGQSNGNLADQSEIPSVSSGNRNGADADSHSQRENAALRASIRRLVLHNEEVTYIYLSHTLPIPRLTSTNNIQQLRQQHVDNPRESQYKPLQCTRLSDFDACTSSSEDEN